MRDREVKSGDLDLVSPAERNLSSTSDIDSERPGELSARHSMTRSYADPFGADSAVSPFWDDAAPTQNTLSGLIDSPSSENELEPTIRTQLPSESARNSPPMSPSLSSPAFSPTQSSVAVSTAPSSSSSRALGTLNKAQKAAASYGSSSSIRRPTTRVPSQAGPRGGFRRHEDAGRLDDVEELPPLYRPEWESESRRESGEQ